MSLHPHQLFNAGGNIIATVKTTSPRPLLISWQNRYFVLDAGRYVEASVHVAETVGTLAVAK